MIHSEIPIEVAFGYWWIAWVLVLGALINKHIFESFTGYFTLRVCCSCHIFSLIIFNIFFTHVILLLKFLCCLTAERHLSLTNSYKFFWEFEWWQVYMPEETQNKLS